MKLRLIFILIALMLPLSSGWSQTPKETRNDNRVKGAQLKAEDSKRESKPVRATSAEEKRALDKGAAQSGAQTSKTQRNDSKEIKGDRRAKSKIAIGDERRLPDDRVPVNRRAMTRDGATGLAQVYSADTGPQGTIRLGLQISGFSSSEFLVSGVEDRFTRGDLSIAYTPIELIEVYLNTRSMSYVNPLGTPSYVQGQGDLKLGAKVGQFWGSLGAGLSLNTQFVSDPNESGWLIDATNFEARGLFTVDLTRRAQAIPFRFLLDIQFTKENTEALTAGLGEEPSLIQEWGYQAARYDRLMLNFGIEAPTQYISPFLEYHIGTPFLVEMPRMGRYSNIFAFESVPHYVAAGLRAFPLDSLSVELGGTIGMSDAPFTGVTATPPWTMWGGISYTLDPRPKVIEREIKIKPPPAPKPAPPKPMGALLSLAVVDAKTQEPIPNAKLQFLDAELSPQLSDQAGFFKGYRLLPKKYVISVSADGYQTKKVRLGVKKGQEERRAKLKLKRDPQRAVAKFSVRYKAPAGEPSADARLELSLIGPKSFKATLTTTTPFERELSPGEYVLVIRGSGDEVYYETITLGSGGEGTRDITPELLSKRGSDDAEKSKQKTNKGRDAATKGSTKWVKYNLKKRRLSTKRAISFDGDSARLTRGAKKVVRGLAAFLKEEQRIKKIVVMVHTHSRGKPKADKRLGYQRAQAVKKLLKSEGVESGRVAVYSYGSDKNIASNLSRRGRQRNQRVALRIKSVDL